MAFGFCGKSSKRPNVREIRPEDILWLDHRIPCEIPMRCRGRGSGRASTSHNVKQEPRTSPGARPPTLSVCRKSKALRATKDKIALPLRATSSELDSNSVLRDS